MIVGEVEIVNVDAFIDQRAFHLDVADVVVRRRVNELLLAAMAVRGYFLGAQDFYPHFRSDPYLYNLSQGKQPILAMTAIKIAGNTGDPTLIRVVRSIISEIQGIEIMNNSRRRRHYQTNIENPSSAVCSVGANSSVNAQIKKIELIERLNEIIDKIGNAKNVSNCIEDVLIGNLQKIEEQAKLYDFKQIVKMANLAIGKRILNIELEKKRTQIENKLEKKRQIQDYFRENRIKKMCYEEIALQKLRENTFIVKPYKDGKAFIESTIFYEKVISCVSGQSYEDYFEECSYLETIKHVNRIFFNNYSNTSSEHSRKQAINNPILKLGFVLLLALVGLSIALSITSEGLISYAILIINMIVVVLMGALSIHSYCNVKLSNNQLEETAVEISAYFKDLNEKNRERGARFEWRCPPQFLYLEVKFDRAPNGSQIILAKQNSTQRY